MRPRVRILGDHSAYHCGSAAVFAVLTRMLERDHTIADGDDYDILYVNGEGSMHHDSGHFIAKMDAMRTALAAGRKVWLVNSVWQGNSSRYDDVLFALSGITVREVFSQADLIERHGVDSSMALDLSFYHEIDEAADHRDWRGQVAITDFFLPDLGAFGRITSGPLSTRSYVDLRDLSWSSLVRSLRTARAIITGRHHAVYAACVARRPFVAVAGSTHKVTGLIAASGFPIPVLTSARDATATLRWAIANRGMYKEFFHWMDEVPRWQPETPLP